MLLSCSAPNQLRGGDLPFASNCRRFGNVGFPNNYYEREFGGMKTIKTPGKELDWVETTESKTVVTINPKNKTQVTAKSSKKVTDFTDVGSSY